MPGVYPSTHVHSLFDGVPSSLSWDLVEAAFRRRVRTGAMLVGVSASTGKVSVAVSADFLNTTAGRAAWRRYKRAQFHLERAASGQQLRSDVLLVMDLKDMVSPREPSDGAVPVFAASARPARWRCRCPCRSRALAATTSSSCSRASRATAGRQRRGGAAVGRAAAAGGGGEAAPDLPQRERVRRRRPGLAEPPARRARRDFGARTRTRRRRLHLRRPTKPNGKPVDPGLARHQRPPLSDCRIAGCRYRRGRRQRVPGVARREVALRLDRARAGRASRCGSARCFATAASSRCSGRT